MTNTSKPKRIDPILTPEFRVGFPSVFVPKSMEEGKPAKYEITMLFPKTTDITAIKKMCGDVMRAKFGIDKTKWPTVRYPWRDGDKDKPHLDGFAGTVFMPARTKSKPGLINARKAKITSEEEFYAGCYARATIGAYWYDNKGNKGVALSLNNIQKTRDGEPFSGRSAAEDDFTEIDEVEAGGSTPVDDDNEI